MKAAPRDSCVPLSNSRANHTVLWQLMSEHDIRLVWQTGRLALI